MKLAISIALLSIAAACGPKSTNSTSGNPCADNPCGGAPTAEVDVSDWENWVKMTDTRLLSKGHGRAYVDIYVEAKHAGLYRGATGPYPVGFKTVKAQYKTPTTTQLKNITVMAKRNRGYDSENGDWWYAVLNENGGVMNQGKIEMCVDCHDQASARDYVFGIPK